MTIKKQATWLPIFTGYYHSIFDCADSYIEYELELNESEFKEYYESLDKAGVTHEYFKENFYDYLDYNKGYIGSSEYLCDGLMELFSNDIILDVKYEKLVSPKYYNFSNDSINCEIEYDEKKLLEYLNENKKELKEYIKNKYTSYDGFSSSYSNELSYWLDAENFGEHEIGSLLQFVLIQENENAEYELFEKSNCFEGFSNAVIFDETKMINDFKKGA
jgi:hypothetical protein